MIVCAMLIPSGVTCWPLSGTALSTTSRPPWRSRPRTGFWWIGEQDRADDGGQDRAHQSQVLAAVTHARRPRLAAVIHSRGLFVLRLLELFGGRDDGPDGAPRHLDS